MTHVQQPSLKQCGVVAKALVDTYRFLRDDEGDGEVRVRYMYTCMCIHYRLCNSVIFFYSTHGSGYYRCQNVNRQSKD